MKMKPAQVVPAPKKMQKNLKPTQGVPQGAKNHVRGTVRATGAMKVAKKATKGRGKTTTKEVIQTAAKKKAMKK